MMEIDGLEYDKTYMHPLVAKGLATDVSNIFNDKSVQELGLTFAAGSVSRFVTKAGLYYSQEALDYFGKRDADEGIMQLDREDSMLARFENDTRLPETTRESIRNLLVARAALATTGHGLYAAEILRYQPGSKLQTHFDRVRTTSISLDGEATMFVDENTLNETPIERILPGHAISLRGVVPHRVESSQYSFRHVLLLTDSLSSN